MFFCYICIRKTILEQGFTQDQRGFTLEFDTPRVLGKIDQFGV